MPILCLDSELSFAFARYKCGWARTKYFFVSYIVINGDAINALTIYIPVEWITYVLDAVETMLLAIPFKIWNIPARHCPGSMNFPYYCAPLCILLQIQRDLEMDLNAREKYSENKKYRS
jgi:hypothetical protein